MNSGGHPSLCRSFPSVQSPLPLTGGNEAYLASKEEIDLLVLDVVMPKMGGIEALGIIRQEDPQIKAMFCTGYDKLNTKTEDNTLSRESVISKPFSINEFSQMLKHALGK